MTTKTELRTRLDEILDDMNWGYQFQMSDYASSRSQEKEYEAAGLEEIENAKRELLALLEDTVREARIEERNQGRSFNLGVDESFDFKAGFEEAIDQMEKQDEVRLVELKEQGRASSRPSAAKPSPGSGVQDKGNRQLQ